MNKILIVVAFALFSFTSKATIITVDNEDWDVTYTLATFNDLNSNDFLVSQAWWGSREKASQFALALGYIDDGDPISFLGPLFAYEIWDGGTDDLFSEHVDVDLRVWSTSTTMTSVEFSFAHAVRVNRVPEPKGMLLCLLGLIGIYITRIKLSS